MNQTNPEPSAERSPPPRVDELPRPVVRRMWWPFPLIWIVPVAAAALAGYYLYQHHKARALEIVIRFDDASGLTPSQSVVQFHGATVGRVQSISLSDDHQSAQVRIRLDQSAEFLARRHTIFWMVKPELSADRVSGLNTLVSGPYIAVAPGDGEPTTQFDGLAEKPVINRPGKKVILHADALGQISVNSPVTYRGIQVGVVQDVRLSNRSDSANITIFIWEKYWVLIRPTTEFWTVKGADIKGGLFSGVEFKVDSLRAILTGGIAFATPENDMGDMVSESSNFFLNDQPKPEWLRWRPKIAIDAPAAPPSQAAGAKAGASPLPNLKHE